VDARGGRIGAGRRLRGSVEGEGMVKGRSVVARDRGWTSD
jgi:hypothetical protein